VRAKRTAFVLVLFLGYYVVVIGDRAVRLMRDERLPAKGLGAGLVLLAFVGVAAVVAEVRFGLATQRLARAAGDVDADFDAAREAAESAPEDWRAWYRLALAYDAGRDTRRGREAMRRAIALERATR